MPDANFPPQPEEGASAHLHKTRVCGRLKFTTLFRLSWNLRIQVGRSQPGLRTSPQTFPFVARLEALSVSPPRLESSDTKASWIRKTFRMNRLCQKELFKQLRSPSCRQLFGIIDPLQPESQHSTSRVFAPLALKASQKQYGVGCFGAETVRLVLAATLPTASGAREPHEAARFFGLGVESSLVLRGALIQSCSATTKLVHSEGREVGQAVLEPSVICTLGNEGAFLSSLRKKDLSHAPLPRRPLRGWPSRSGRRVLDAPV